eukprot:gb/GECG01006888.1/.p1 GENE.gb/GECG01006888.1/~~gb/GECG01006888.1/.p1  ORF type:complete len:694 (+),score=65.80 gb/GECG01006888.1/:1-2082(+)
MSSTGNNKKSEYQAILPSNALSQPNESFSVYTYEQCSFSMIHEVPAVVGGAAVIALIETGIGTISEHTAWAIGNSVFAVYMLLGIPFYIFMTTTRDVDSDKNAPVRVIGAVKEDQARESISECSEISPEEEPETEGEWSARDHSGIKYITDSNDPITALTACISFAAVVAGIALSWISYVLDKTGSYWHYQIIWFILAAIAIRFARQERIEMVASFGGASHTVSRVARGLALLTLYSTVLLHTPTFLGHFVTYLFSTLGLNSVSHMKSEGGLLSLASPDNPTVEQTSIGIFSSVGYMVCMQMYVSILEKCMDAVGSAQSFPRLLFLGQAYYYFYFYIVTAGSSDTPIWMFLFNTMLMNVNYVLSGTGSYYEIYKHVHNAYQSSEDAEVEDNDNSAWILYLKNLRTKTRVLSCATMTALTKIFVGSHDLSPDEHSQSQSPEFASAPSKREVSSRGRTATEDDITYKAAPKTKPAGNIQSLIYLIRMAEQDTLADISTLLVAPATITILSILGDRQPRLGAPSGFENVDTFSVWCRFITMALVRTISARIMRKVFSHKIEKIIAASELEGAENTKRAKDDEYASRFHRRLMERRKSLSILRPSDSSNTKIAFTEALHKAAKQRETYTDGLFGINSKTPLAGSLYDTSFGPDSPFYSATMQRFDECFPYFVSCFLFVVCVCLQTPAKPLRYAFYSG